MCSSLLTCRWATNNTNLGKFDREITVQCMVSVGAQTSPPAMLMYALSSSICQESCQGSGQASSVTASLQMQEPSAHAY